MTNLVCVEKGHVPVRNGEGTGTAPEAVLWGPVVCLRCGATL